jgi:hypothetical protein
MAKQMNGFCVEVVKRAVAAPAPSPDQTGIMKRTPGCAQLSCSTATLLVQDYGLLHITAETMM